MIHRSVQKFLSSALCALFCVSCVLGLRSVTDADNDALAAAGKALPKAVGSFGTLITPEWVLTTKSRGNQEWIFFDNKGYKVIQSVPHPTSNLQLLRLIEPVPNKVAEPILPCSAEQIERIIEGGYDLVFVGSTQENYDYYPKDIMNFDLGRQLGTYKRTSSSFTVPDEAWNTFLLPNNGKSGENFYAETWDDGAGVFVKIDGKYVLAGVYTSEQTTSEDWIYQSFEEGSQFLKIFRADKFLDWAQQTTQAPAPKKPEKTSWILPAYESGRRSAEGPSIPLGTWGALIGTNTILAPESIFPEKIKINGKDHVVDYGIKFPRNGVHLLKLKSHVFDVPLTKLFHIKMNAEEGEDPDFSEIKKFFNALSCREFLVVLPESNDLSDLRNIDFDRGNHKHLLRSGDSKGLAEEDVETNADLRLPFELFKEATAVYLKENFGSAFQYKLFSVGRMNLMGALPVIQNLMIADALFSGQSDDEESPDVLRIDKRHHWPDQQEEEEEEEEDPQHSASQSGAGGEEDSKYKPLTILGVQKETTWKPSSGILIGPNYFISEKAQNRFYIEDQSFAVLDSEGVGPAVNEIKPLFKIGDDLIMPFKRSSYRVPSELSGREFYFLGTRPNILSGTQEVVRLKAFIDDISDQSWITLKHSLSGSKISCALNSPVLIKQNGQFELVGLVTAFYALTGLIDIRWLDSSQNQEISNALISNALGAPSDDAGYLSEDTSSNEEEEEDYNPLNAYQPPVVINAFDSITKTNLPAYIDGIPLGPLAMLSSYMFRDTFSFSNQDIDLQDEKRFDLRQVFDESNVPVALKWFQSPQPEISGYKRFSFSKPEDLNGKELYCIVQTRSDALEELKEDEFEMFLEEEDYNKPYQSFLVKFTLNNLSDKLFCRLELPRLKGYNSYAASILIKKGNEYQLVGYLDKNDFGSGGTAFWLTQPVNNVINNALIHEILSDNSFSSHSLINNDENEED